ncbi:MAG: prepilin-type N-terminal cleavage/methylation domain-containing protein [Patescibacteria group bacterium]|nr:prepilin-type N-terminal cleavage/methylation domain-containing protein [Patescibacteria group bacterium]
MRKIRNKKGMTIIELVVAMTIFLVVVTLAVGGFVSLLNLQTQSETMTGVQQNARIAIEQITRQAREALKVTIGQNNITVNGTTFTCTATYNCFSLTIQESLTLRTFTFYVDPADSKLKVNDSSVGYPLTITSEDVRVTQLNFTQPPVNKIPPIVDISLGLAPRVSTSAFTQDQTTINTTVIMTGIK